MEIKDIQAFGKEPDITDKHPRSIPPLNPIIFEWSETNFIKPPVIYSTKLEYKVSTNVIKFSRSEIAFSLDSSSIKPYIWIARGGLERPWHKESLAPGVASSWNTWELSQMRSPPCQQVSKLCKSKWGLPSAAATRCSVPRILSTGGRAWVLPGGVMAGVSRGQQEAGGERVSL